MMFVIEELPLFQRLIVVGITLALTIPNFIMIIKRKWIWKS